MRKTIAAALMLVLAGAACQKGATTAAPEPAGPPSASPAPTATPVVSKSTSPKSASTEVTLWYLVSAPSRLYLAPEKHRIRATQAIAKAALEELIHGKPQDLDHIVPYSPASRIRSVSIANRVATVDWSAEVLRNHKAGSEVEALGIQQVVYTLTQFPTVSAVRFTVEGRTRGTASNGADIESWWGHVGLDGQPFVTADYMENVEPIIMWTPGEASSSTGTLTLRGEVIAPDGSHRDTMAVRLLDADGRQVVRTTVYGQRDPNGHQPWHLRFAKTIAFKPPASRQTWTLEIAHLSLKDGSVEFRETRNLRVG